MPLVRINGLAGQGPRFVQALYAAIATRLAGLEVDSKDLIISLVEVKKECWSFGNGIAQYVPAA